MIFNERVSEIDPQGDSAYVHYFFRPREIPTATFNKIVADATTIITALQTGGLELRIDELSPEAIAFDEPALRCGHPIHDKIEIAWPDNLGACGPLKREAYDDDWTWPFEFRRVDDYAEEPFIPRPRGTRGFTFGFCDTALYPMDLAVTAILLAAKHHLGKGLRIITDGEDEGWLDARRICQELLGFGREFRVNDSEVVARA